MVGSVQHDLLLIFLFLLHALDPLSNLPPSRDSPLRAPVLSPPLSPATVFAVRGCVDIGGE